MDLNDYAIDVDKAEGGVWVPLDGETSVRIKRFGNKAFQNLMNSLTAPYKRQMRRQSLDDALMEDILTKAMAKEILVDWKCLKVNGEEVPYSYEQALEILANPKFKDFRNDVMIWSQDFELFRQEDVDVTVEKSLAT